MNQEKLAKLQAQVRIGGKVITVTSFPLLILHFFTECYMIVINIILRFLLQVIITKEFC